MTSSILSRLFALFCCVWWLDVVRPLRPRIHCQLLGKYDNHTIYQEDILCEAAEFSANNVDSITGNIFFADYGCNDDSYNGINDMDGIMKVVAIKRGNCGFAEKAKLAFKYHANACIVIENNVDATTLTVMGASDADFQSKIPQMIVVMASHSLLNLLQQIKLLHLDSINNNNNNNNNNNLPMTTDNHQINLSIGWLAIDVKLRLVTVKKNDNLEIIRATTLKEWLFSSLSISPSSSLEASTQMPGDFSVCSSLDAMQATEEAWTSCTWKLFSAYINTTGSSSDDDKISAKSRLQIQLKLLESHRIFLRFAMTNLGAFNDNDSFSGQNYAADVIPSTYMTMIHCAGLLYQKGNVPISRELWLKIIVNNQHRGRNQWKCSGLATNSTKTAISEPFEMLFHLVGCSAKLIARYNLLLDQLFDHFPRIKSASNVHIMSSLLNHVGNYDFTSIRDMMLQDGTEGTFKSMALVLEDLISADDIATKNITCCSWELTFLPSNASNGNSNEKLIEMRILDNLTRMKRDIYYHLVRISTAKIEYFQRDRGDSELMLSALVDKARYLTNLLRIIMANANWESIEFIQDRLKKTLQVIIDMQSRSLQHTKSSTLSSLCGTLLPGMLGDAAYELALGHHIACHSKTIRIHEQSDHLISWQLWSRFRLKLDQLLANESKAMNSFGIALVSPSFRLSHPAGQQMFWLLDAWRQLRESTNNTLYAPTLWCVSHGTTPSTSTKRIPVPSELKAMKSLGITGYHDNDFPPTLCKGGIFHIKDTLSDSEIDKTIHEISQQSTIRNYSSIARWQAHDVAMLFRILNVQTVVDIAGFTSSASVYRMLAIAKRIYREIFRTELLVSHYSDRVNPSVGGLGHGQPVADEYSKQYGIVDHMLADPLTTPPDMIASSQSSRISPSEVKAARMILLQTEFLVGDDITSSLDRTTGNVSSESEINEAATPSAISSSYSNHRLPRPIVFAHVGRLDKVDVLTFRVWCSILRTMPSAELWILSPDSTNDDFNSNKSGLALPELIHPGSTRDYLIQEALAQGVASRRLQFLPRANHSVHLARLKHYVDIALDSRYFNGLTTTADILRTGVPLLTLQGVGAGKLVSHQCSYHARGASAMATLSNVWPCFHNIKSKCSRYDSNITNLLSSAHEQESICKCESWAETVTHSTRSYEDAGVDMASIVQRPRYPRPKFEVNSQEAAVGTSESEQRRRSAVKSIEKSSLLRLELHRLVPGKRYHIIVPSLRI